ncbi:alpha/beta fold hydrolase [Halovivax limisalsi]|uniref:alpha/beta fold hydrolase n=1 Tax=Halovivax limisalsi TaxID=1453760 RepID=UPI001FFC721A|nr:alpha/beta fold hydrolase [Halovivax limisalsi]
MPHTSRDGVTLRYEADRTDDPAGVVVFLQGLGLGRWAWRWQREALRDRYDVLAPDTRGAGVADVRTDGGVRVAATRVTRSDDGLGPLVPRLPGRIRRPVLARRAAYSVAGLAADLEAVLADVGERSVHLVGQGLGAAVAIEHARAYRRAESLALVGAHAGGAAFDLPAEIRETILDPDGSTERLRVRNRLRPYFSQPFLARHPRLVDEVIDWQAMQGPSQAALEAGVVAWERFDATDWLDRVDVPTLVVHGDADRLVPVDAAWELADRLPNAECEVVDEAGHLVGVEADRVVNDRLRDFLSFR